MKKNFKAKDCFYTVRNAHKIMLLKSSLGAMRHIYWGRADPDQTTAVTLATDDTSFLKPRLSQSRPNRDLHFGFLHFGWVFLGPLPGPAHRSARPQAAAVLAGET